MWNTWLADRTSNACFDVHVYGDHFDGIIGLVCGKQIFNNKEFSLVLTFIRERERRKKTQIKVLFNNRVKWRNMSLHKSSFSLADLP